MYDTVCTPLIFMCLLQAGAQLEAKFANWWNKVRSGDAYTIGQAAPMVLSVIVAPDDIGAAASKASKAESLLGKAGTFSKSMVISSAENVKNIVTLPGRLLYNIGNKAVDLGTIFSKGKGLVGNFTKSVVVSSAFAKAFGKTYVVESAKYANTCFSASSALEAGVKNFGKAIVAGGKNAKSALKFVKTSYVKSIADLKNVEKFKEGSLEHILEGQLNNRGKAVGFHYEGMPTAKGKIIPGTESEPNEFGIYTAKVEVNGVPKTANGGMSSFFPKDWDAQNIVDGINEAYGSKEFVRGSRNTFRGKTSQGIRIEMYIDSATGKIISAFPIY